MNGKWIDAIRAALLASRERTENRLKGNLLTYAAFLLIAVAIWYLNALSKDYTADLKFSVRFVNLPTDRILVRAPEERLTLTVSAQGFTLLKYRMGLIFRSLSIDADAQALKRDRHTPPGEHFILASSAFASVSAQLGAEIRLSAIAPDTLRFVFSEMARKRVPVKVRAEFRFEREFLATAGMTVEPEMITVSGPRSIVDTLSCVYSVEKRFGKLKDRLQASLPLQPVEKLAYSVSEVKIDLPVERHTEATMTVPVEALNLPAGYAMKTFPAAATVTCMVPINRFDALKPRLFRVTVDYALIKSAGDGSSKAKLTVTRAPEYVSDVRVHPHSVDFVIER
ncbi:MAG: hypothetical protein LBR08_01815 [Bacteroidales bacterium]|jgi:hypothetical protein|nr:hypothetical protein [Bacteroidales bacterium]